MVMRQMKKTPCFIFTLLVASHCLAQVQPIYKLEDRIMKGDGKALDTLVTYLDSDRVVTEYMLHLPKQPF